ncbi:hypothetical protein [Nonomuraea wenchangensis]|uniref:Uncharacterized protein n=1 Tax=Nonomuraea wenchangensis TaxID=568860 RepID=A0A1I0K721_9ACTN|nr:hypothetical protein [Nonomuraea wenchangensis]SEU18882.1 hypothetical protein SAMN05421811_10757 [Nonomuraea wenchangensis]
MTPNDTIAGVEGEKRARAHVARLALNRAQSAALDGQAHLLRLNSEFAAYVPPHRRRPDIQLRETGDPDYFPPGAKHRYTRG